MLFRSLKRDYELAIQASEREAYKRPGDQAAQLALQRIRYEYAASGILDPGARGSIVNECRERLEPLAERMPEASLLLYLVERISRPDRALAVLDQLEAADPARQKRWTRERAELLFALGRFEEIRALLLMRAHAFEGEDATAGDYDWRSALLWWTNG